MKCPLSPTPSLNQQLDRIRCEQEPALAAEAPPVPRWRYASDMLGMVMFFVLLGTYLAVHL